MRASVFVVKMFECKYFYLLMYKLSVYTFEFSSYTQNSLIYLEKTAWGPFLFGQQSNLHF